MRDSLDSACSLALSDRRESRGNGESTLSFWSAILLCLIDEREGEMRRVQSACSHCGLSLSLTDESMGNEESEFVFLFLILVPVYMVVER